MKIRTKEIVCCYCGTTMKDHKLLWEKDGFRYVKCTNCDLIFVNPRLEKNEIVTIYKKGFESKKSVKEHVPDRSTYAPILEWMRMYRATNKILDVGCFTGDFMRVARNDGWEVFGTEISESAAKHAEKAYGLNVSVGELCHLKLPDDEFDVVTFSDVIEHVDNPYVYLQEAHRILRDGGAIYMNTPNIGSLTHLILKSDWAAIFPWHQHYFSQKTMNRFLTKLRFRNIAISSYGFAPFSKFNPCESLRQDGKITKQKGSLRRLVSHRPAMKKVAHIIIRVLNWPFFLISRLGINLGATLIIKAEK